VPTDRTATAREAWLDVLDLLDEDGIPATWAVVGRLFSEASVDADFDHPAGGEWVGRSKRDALPDAGWEGRDLIDAVHDSDVGHEIGSHSYSHVEFGDPDTSREIAEAELQRSVVAAERYGIDLESFVFPRNEIGHRDLLADHGFTAYRGRAPDRWYEASAVRRLGKLATFTIGTASPPIVDPVVDEHGLVNVPASMYLFTFEGSVRDAVGTAFGDPVVRQVELGLERLRTRNRGVLHLWLHPNNVTTERDRTRLSEIASLIADYRDRDAIEVEPMRGIARRVRTDE
jgi:peptidoglycan/xylan/chitin deacetylase (PgdA/CDA1 family)